MMRMSGSVIKNLASGLIPAAVILLAVLTGGCGTSGIVGSASSMRGSGGDIRESKVTVYNPLLARYIKITELKTVFTGDLLQANVTVFSKSLDTLNLQYKFRWYNSEGMEVLPEFSPWQPLVLYGKETKGIQALAPNPEVKEFKIEIRSKE